MTLARMDEYPVLFTYREMVASRGFVAGVIVDGRALLVDEKTDGWWVYGVEPGALSETGDSSHEALFEYRKAFSAVLADMAAEAANFDEFKRKVEAFFAQKDAEDERRWLVARELLQAGATTDASLSALPKERAEAPRRVLIARLDDAKAEKIPAAVISSVEEVGLPAAA